MDMKILILAKEILSTSSSGWRDAEQELTWVLNVKRYRIPVWLRVTIIVPLCLFLYVALSGYFFGASKHILGVIVSWFVIIPMLNALLSNTISGKENFALKALISLITFYGIMVFMIYKHYQSDFFKIMIASLIFNSIILLVCIAVNFTDRYRAKWKLFELSGRLCILHVCGVAS